MLRRTQPTAEQRRAQEAAVAEQELARLVADQQVREQERAEQLKNAYRAGEPTPRMAAAIEKSQWYHEVLGSSLLPPGNRVIPSFDQGEFEQAARAAKAAVADVMRPVIAAIELEIEDATRERDAIVAGRGR